MGLTTLSLRGRECGAAWTRIGQRSNEEYVSVSFAAPEFGSERAFNRRFLQMMSHYLVEPTPCTPGAAWRKDRSKFR